MRTKYAIDETAKDAVKHIFRDAQAKTIPQAAWAMGRSVPEVRAIVKCLFREKAIFPVGKTRCNITRRSEMRYTTNEQAAWTILYHNSRPAWRGIGPKKQTKLMEVVKAYVGARFVESGFTIPPELEEVWPGVKIFIDDVVAGVWRKDKGKPRKRVAKVEDLTEKEGAE